MAETETRTAAKKTASRPTAATATAAASASTGDPIYMKHPKHGNDAQPITAVSEDQAQVFEQHGWKRVKTPPTEQ